MVMNPFAMWETWIWFLGWEVPLEEGMTTHFSTLAWRTPWTEEPGCVQSMGLQKVTYDWETKDSTVRAYTILWFCNRLLVRPLAGEVNGNLLQYSCLENPMHGGSWLAVVHGVARSRKWLSNFTFTFHFQALEKEMAPTPVFLPGESQGWWSLVGCHLWGPTELDMTEPT